MKEEEKEGWRCPRWLGIVLPAMLQLAHTMALDLEVVFRENDVVLYVEACREEFIGDLQCYPSLLLSYLEALPPSCVVTEEEICNNLSEDGSLFQSPSASAMAFITFGNQRCLAYLRSLAQTFPNAGLINSISSFFQLLNI